MNGDGPVRFEYVFKFDDGEDVRFAVKLDPRSLALIREEEAQPPAWARLSEVGCAVCELDGAEHRHCPVAVSLSGVVQRFAKRFSYEKVKVQVTTAERVISSDTSLQQALSSLIGIYMVTAGCPTMDKLRPMVRFHLPLATLQETVYRVVSTYLLGECLRKRRGQDPDWNLDGLYRIYSDVHEVNLAFTRCIRKAAPYDANANALVHLDLFTDVVTLSVQDALANLEYLFDPSYLGTAPKSEAEQGL